MCLYVRYNLKYHESEFSEIRRLNEFNLRFYFTGIYFRVIGYGKCNWTDFLRRDSIPVETTTKNERSDIKFWGDEEYINATVYVIGSKNGICFAI